MNRPRPVRHCRLAWSLPLFTLLTLGTLAPAQEPEPITALRNGFTRPGAPEDGVVAGKVVPAVDNPELRKTAMGGTVYFRVIERTGDDWNEVREFQDLFQPGIDAGGVSSPNFDAN